MCFKMRVRPLPHSLGSRLYRELKPSVIPRWMLLKPGLFLGLKSPPLVQKCMVTHLLTCSPFAGGGGGLILQYLRVEDFFFIVVGFVIHWHESAMDLHVFPIPIPPPTSLSTRSLWVFPVHQVRALVSCIQPGLVIGFTLDNIHVSMLFSWNIPPSPSPTESKRLFYTSVSLFLFCI